MIKVIFFDFDGVIVESLNIKTKAFGALFKEQDEKAVKRIVDYHLSCPGVSRYEKFRYIYKEILCRRLSDDEFEKLCSRFANLVVDAVLLAPYVRGARQFLERYASSYRFFLLSATPKSEIKKIINQRNLRHFFTAIFGAPDKKSEVIKSVLIKARLKPVNAVYVGDGLADYLAAKDNAVHFIARLNNNESLFKDVDCPKIKDLTALDKIIEKI